MNLQINGDQAKAYVDGIYRQVAERWQQRVSSSQFMVSPEDFELAAKKMKDWGVKVYDIPTVERPTGRGFYFFDPDGNLLQLYAPPKTPSAS